MKESIHPAYWAIHKANPREEMIRSASYQLPMGTGILPMTVSSVAIRGLLRIHSVDANFYPSHGGPLAQALRQAFRGRSSITNIRGVSRDSEQVFVEWLTNYEKACRSWSHGSTEAEAVPAKPAAVIREHVPQPVPDKLPLILDQKRDDMALQVLTALIAKPENLYPFIEPAMMAERAYIYVDAMLKAR